MSVSPPVHQQRDWRHLQRVTVNEHRSLGAMVQKAFRAQMTCAASVAVWLLQHRPDLVARPRLHLLVAHATEFEALDSGRWLQFIPWLLGRPGLELRASIAFRTPEVLEADDPEALLKTHSWGLVKDRRAADLVREPLADWLGAGCLPDLCAVFSPEFAQHHAALLGPAGLLPVVQAQVPLALFSASEAEQLVDVFTLRTFGLAPLDPECWPNPWALEPGGCGKDTAYARMGWAAEFDAAPAAAQPNRDHLVALEEALTYVRGLLDVSGDDAFLSLGEPIRAAGLNGEDADSVLLRLPHEVAVDTANGHVYQVGDSTAWLLGSVPKLPLDALAGFPGHEDLVARAMWAVGIHRDHVLPFSRALDEELRQALAERI